MIVTEELHSPWQRIKGTRLKAYMADGFVSVLGPCGHEHKMTVEEAAYLCGWLYDRTGWMPEEWAARQEMNAMLDAEIGAR